MYVFMSACVNVCVLIAVLKFNARRSPALVKLVRMVPGNQVSWLTLAASADKFKPACSVLTSTCLYGAVLGAGQRWLTLVTSAGKPASYVLAPLGLTNPLPTICPK